MQYRRDIGPTVRCLAFSACLAATMAAPDAGAGEAEPVLPSPAARAFERFVQSSSPICLRQPSTDCVDQGWIYGDVNGDGALSAEELALVESAVREWYDWRHADIPNRDRLLIVLGLWIVGQIGLEHLVASFDTDGDGLVTREELLVDVRLDERPLGPVLLDADAVDRGAIARRLGAFAPVLGTFFE